MIIGRWACAAALIGLAGCGDGGSDRATAPSGGSITIDLPEPTTVASDQGTANLADGNAQANSSAIADAEPGPEAEPLAAEPVRTEVKPSPRAEPSEVAPTSARAEEREGPSPPAQSASLPLPDAVIVRTIERIGYSCGSILSSSKIDGSSDYRINCSSGASYRASNRTGRYRFSKAN